MIMLLGQAKNKYMFWLRRRVTKNGVTADIFFFFATMSFFFFLKWTIFFINVGGKEKELRPSDSPLLRPPAGPETEFFLGWPYFCAVAVALSCWEVMFVCLWR